jgi:hypothetical protein
MKNLFLQKLPNLTAMKIHRQGTVYAAWTAITKEYMEKSVFAQTELHTSFLESKCAKKGNIRQFLDDLQTKREELSSVSIDVDDKDYRSMIISLLPTYLPNFVSSQLAVAKLYSPSKTIEPDALISLILEEFKCQKTQCTCHAGRAKSKEDTDEALFAGNVKKGRNLKRKPKHEPVCWNCDKPSHIKPNCPEPLKKLNNSKAKPKAKESANAATDSDPLSDWEEGGAFGIEEFSDVESLPGEITLSISLKNSLPKLLTVSASSINDDDDCSDDGDDSADLFSDCGDDCALEKDFSPEVDWETVLTVQEIAHVSGAKSSPTKIELIDSGCTHHISPYQEDFTSFEEILPKSFWAANKQRFSAVGMGELTIDLPNSTDGSKLALTKVLYSSEVGYTLVLVGWLDDLGFIMIFGSGKCTIHGPDGNVIGEVPKSSSGLYRVEHETDIANAIEFITLESHGPCLS